MECGLGADQARPGRTWQGYDRGYWPECVGVGVARVTEIRRTAYQAHPVRAPWSVMPSIKSEVLRQHYASACRTKTGVCARPYSLTSFDDPPGA